jgi:hypothetical protein
MIIVDILSDKPNGPFASCQELATLLASAANGNAPAQEALASMDSGWLSEQLPMAEAFAEFEINGAML